VFGGICAEGAMQNIVARHSVVAASWGLRETDRSTMRGAACFALVLFASAAILIVAVAAHPEFFTSSFSQLGPAMP
jgi:hypothetical protein